jgi:hypothetical protein
MQKHNKKYDVKCTHQYAINHPTTIIRRLHPNSMVSHSSTWNRYGTNQSNEYLVDNMEETSNSRYVQNNIILIVSFHIA